MKAVIQRVSYAKVEVENKIVGNIDKGLLVFVGIGNEDVIADLEWMAKKLIALRIFNDADDKMNLSISDVGGDLLIVSQFTLMADCKKGNRPSYIAAAPPTISEPLYNQFLEILKKQFPGKIETGIFGANMKITLLNDGPVTILLDSKN